MTHLLPPDGTKMPRTAEYSATSGDYWQHPADEPLTGGDGEPLVLAERVTTFRDALTRATL